MIAGLTDQNSLTSIRLCLWLRLAALIFLLCVFHVEGNLKMIYSEPSNEFSSVKSQEHLSPKQNYTQPRELGAGWSFTECFHFRLSLQLITVANANQYEDAAVAGQCIWYGQFKRSE